MAAEAYPQPVDDGDKPAAELTASSMLIERVRAVQRGSQDEAELKKTLAQMKDIHEGVVAFGELVVKFGEIAGNLGKGASGAKWLAAILAGAITVHPVIGAFLPQPSVTGQLDAIGEELERARAERRETTRWLWDLERCRANPADDGCPVKAPPSVRIMAAQYDQENGR